MVHLLKAEFSYHWIIYLGFFSLLPFFALYAANPFIADLPPVFLMFILVYLMPTYWNIYRNREKRDRLLALLPVSSIITAFTRVFIIVISIVTFYLGFVLLKKIIQPGSGANYPLLMKSISIYLIGFSVYYLVRDLLTGFFRKLGFTKEKLLLAFVSLGVILNLLSLILWAQAEAAGSPVIPFFRFIDFLVEFNPFVGPDGLIFFLLLIVFCVAATITSYRLRSNYCE